MEEILRRWMFVASAVFTIGAVNRLNNDEILSGVLHCVMAMCLVPKAR